MGRVPTLDLRWFIMGDENSDDVPAALIVKMAPGHVLSRHCHDCERFEVVVAGSLDVGDKILGPGDVMVAHAGEFYGPHIAGPEGCIAVEVFGIAGESYKVIHETADGSIVKTNALAGEKRPDKIAGMDGVSERAVALLATQGDADGN
jgi:hypothetical protein